MDNNETPKPQNYYCYPPQPHKYPTIGLNIMRVGHYTKGVTVIKPIDSLILSNSIYGVKHLCVDIDLLVNYFPGIGTRSLKSCYKLMQSINVSGYKCYTYHMFLLNGHSDSIKRYLGDLILLGYVGSRRKARFMPMLQRYKYDTVYYVTRKGKDCLRGIYEAIGLM